jgi:biopolymer transport protein TolR
LVVTVNAAGKIYLQETTVEDDSLVPRLRAITNNNPEASIYVRGDKSINYGRVLEIMSMISAAGFSKVSLVAEPPTGKAGKPS